MNIKVGDKIRIKTEEELLAEGWQVEDRRFVKGDLWLWRTALGHEYKVEKLDKDGVHFETKEWRLPIEAVEVISQTLDEYICDLPLEKRAEKFVYKYTQFLYGGFDSRYIEIFASALLQKCYDTYDEALQATIEALKGEKR